MMQSVKKADSWYKNDMKNLVNFAVSSVKSENFHFVVLLLPKVHHVRAKNVKELCVITIKNGAKFEEELTSDLRNDMRSLANFNPALESLKIYTIMDSFCSKYIMFELKMYIGGMRHYTEDRCSL